MILDQLVAAARASSSERRALLPENALFDRLSLLPEPIDFAGALRRPGVAVIAEIKRASPSRGALNVELDPGPLAAEYAAAGADAISVLTESSRFRGELDDLAKARQAMVGVGLARPLLRKDFIVDVYQLLEARVKGADAALLIVAALDDVVLARLVREANDLGLTPLVEVHNRLELERALRVNPSVLGINNRNLHDFVVDMNTTLDLLPHVPSECVVVSESGISDPAQISQLKALGVDAVLVGEALVTAQDPGAKLRQLLEAGR